MKDGVVEGGVGEGSGVGDVGGGVVEEGVVLDAQAGDDGHVDLDVVALYGGGDYVEGGKGEAQEGSGGGGEGEGERRLWAMGVPVRGSTGGLAGAVRTRMMPRRARA